MFSRIILWLLARRLSILQTRQTAHKVNDAKTLQLQPFVLTQSINDLLTLNDSFATEEAKTKTIPNYIKERQEDDCVCAVRVSAFFLLLKLFCRFFCLAIFFFSSAAYLNTLRSAKKKSHILTQTYTTSTCAHISSCLLSSRYVQ